MKKIIFHLLLLNTIPALQAMDTGSQEKDRASKLNKMIKIDSADRLWSCFCSKNINDFAGQTKIHEELGDKEMSALKIDDAISWSVFIHYKPDRFYENKATWQQARECVIKDPEIVKELELRQLRALQEANRYYIRRRCCAEENNIAIG